MNINNLNPAIDKKFLILLAGVMWFGVGLMLLRYAITWLIPMGRGSLIFALAGFASAMAIHHFGFLKVVNKNLRRIDTMKEKNCAFSFMSFKSYFLVIIMVSMGIALRHSSLPKQDLSILYSGIGLALLLSSIRYIRTFIQQL